jgi:ubiquinone/menaquinone biosynthesis C-methylase UbiE
VGCGYAAPAAWLLAIYPTLQFLACDPDEERFRIAVRILGKRGRVLRCGAMDLPLANERADAVLLLDVLHYLSDSELAIFLTRLQPILLPEGRLIIRVTISAGKCSFFRVVESFKLKWKGTTAHLRNAEDTVRQLETAGFKIELIEATSPGREETWFIARTGA